MHKGILSTLGNNFTDNKTRYYIKDIGTRISTAISSFKSKSRLIDLLYYTTNTTEQLNFIPYIQNNVYSGITMTYMTNKNFQLLNDSLVTFVGYRITAGSNLLTPQYNETLTINTPQGNIVATATYSDSGAEFITTIDSQRYLVLNSDGKYSNVSYIIIYFDNDGTKFGNGVLHTRRIEVYEYFQ